MKNQAIRAALPHSQLAFYEKMETEQGVDALDLYFWNSRLSGAFWFPLEICEYVTKSAVVKALNNTYGETWFSHKGFEKTFKTPKNHKKSKSLEVLEKIINEIKEKNPKITQNQEIEPEKIITNLTLGFWCHMFAPHTLGFIWNSQLKIVLPNMDFDNLSMEQCIKKIYHELNEIRILRNKIAHHEHIIDRNLTQDYQNIITMIGFYNKDTQQEVEALQTITEIIEENIF